jgi:hypothetical protein
LQIVDKVPYRGVAFEYRDMMLIVPPLPLDPLREQDEKLEALGEQPEAVTDGATTEDKKQMNAAKRKWTNERMVIFRDTILMALKRNYPDITEEEVKDLVTMENVFDMFQAAQGFMASAKKVRSLGEIEPVEVVAVNQASA